MTTETKTLTLSWDLYGSHFGVSLDVKSEVSDYSRKEIEAGLAAGRVMLVDAYGCAIAQYHSHYRADQAAGRGDFIIDPHNARVVQVLQAAQRV